MITTQRKLREVFWMSNPELKRVPGKTQNDYPTDTRLAWCDYIDNMCRTGMIDEALAQRATL